MAMSQDYDAIIDHDTCPVNDEEAKASKKKFIGSDWAKLIRFYPEAERKDSINHHNITEDELMTELTKLVGVNEKIKHVWDYKVPLTKQQLTYMLLYHEFLILETDCWWWSIEKHSDAITIQRSREASCVKDYIRRKPRNKGRARLVKGTGSVSIYELLNWIQSNGELRKEYNVATSNCKHFAEAVLDQVAEINDAKSNPLRVKSRRRSLRYAGSFPSKRGYYNPSGNGNETNTDVHSIPERDRVDEFTKKETNEIQEIFQSGGTPFSRSFDSIETFVLQPASETKLNVDEDYLPFISGQNEEAEIAGPQSRHDSDASLTWEIIEPQELPPSMDQTFRILEDLKNLHEETNEIQEIFQSGGTPFSRSFDSIETFVLQPASETKLNVDEDYLPFISGQNEEAEKAGPQSRHDSDASLTWEIIEPQELPPSMDQTFRILEDLKNLHEETNEIQEIFQSGGTPFSRSFDSIETFVLQPASETKLNVDEDYLPFISGQNEGG